jgi:hypothetical protein
MACAQAPESARTDHTHAPRRMLLWHANHHPDGGHLFFPQQRQPFYVPLALPGDDVKPGRFVCFRFDGRQALYILRAAGSAERPCNHKRSRAREGT